MRILLCFPFSPSMPSASSLLAVGLTTLGGVSLFCTGVAHAASAQQGGARLSGLADIEDDPDRAVSQSRMKK